MSQYNQHPQYYLHQTNNVVPHHVVPNENDVLCGRGVNISQHPGNERFRTLVNAKLEAALSSFHGDPEAAAALEKRDVAEGIIAHIKGLDPPGRFLRREAMPGRRSSTRGKNGSGLDLSGTWRVLSDREAIKKACQALRDCARTDRNGYAVGVLAPPDVLEVAHQVAGTKRPSTAVISIAPKSFDDAFSRSGQNLPVTIFSGIDTWEEGRFSPSVDVAASWLKRQKVNASMNPNNNFENIATSLSTESGSMHTRSQNNSVEDLSTDAAIYAVAMSIIGPQLMSASPQLGEYGTGSFVGDDRSFTPEDINHHTDASDRSNPLHISTDSSSLLTDHPNPYHSHPDDVSLSQEVVEVAANLVSSMQNDPANSDWGEEMVSAPDEVTGDDDIDHHEAFSQSHHTDFPVGVVDDFENLTATMPI